LPLLILRGLLKGTSASGRILDACEDRRLLILLSKPVIEEYRRVLTTEPLISTRPDFTPERVEKLLQRLRYGGDYFNPIKASFVFDRDPRDAKFIELAIAGHATHIISHDADLLTLPASHGDAGKRFRQRLRDTQIVDALGFATAHRVLLGGRDEAT
jgi:putative PIN family toxin of toxin-antitoxin system